MIVFWDRHPSISQTLVEKIVYDQLPVFTKFVIGHLGCQLTGCAGEGTEKNCYIVSYNELPLFCDRSVGQSIT